MPKSRIKKSDIEFLLLFNETFRSMLEDLGTNITVSGPPNFKKIKIWCVNLDERLELRLHRIIMDSEGSIGFEMYIGFGDSGVSNTYFASDATDIQSVYDAVIKGLTISRPSSFLKRLGQKIKAAIFAHKWGNIPPPTDLPDQKPKAKSKPKTKSKSKSVKK